MLKLKTELDKLEEYLINNRITFERIDEEAIHDETRRYLIRPARHQICVPEEGPNCKWDVICHPGSYGYEEGKLEIYGEIVTEEDGDSVVGWLMAADVIKRLEERNAK